MQRLPYFIMGGSIVLALATAIIAGGDYWIVPALIIPVIAIYFVFDRKLKHRETEQEQAAEG